VNHHSLYAHAKFEGMQSSQSIEMVSGQFSFSRALQGKSAIISVNTKNSHILKRLLATVQFLSLGTTCLSKHC
jgi:hypothetical protein